MITESHRIADGSTLVRAIHTIATQLRAWVAASWLARASAGVASGLATTADASLLAEGVRTNVYWTRNSFLYRWLTKEPDPAVVVIDLRETYTVGAVIALLDRLAPTVERAWRESGAFRLVEEVRTSPKLEWIERSRTLRLLAAALEPPEPPEDERTTADGTDSKDP